MQLTYKFAAMLTRDGHRRLDEALALNRELYNAANEERRRALGLRGVDKTRAFISKKHQSRELTAIRAEFPEFAAQDRRIQIGTLERIDKAFQAVWRNRKRGLRAGYPRFKNAYRFRTLEVYSGASKYLKSAGILAGRYQVAIKGLPSIRIHDKNGRIPADTQPLVIRIVRKPKRVEVHMCFNIESSAINTDANGGMGLDMGVSAQAVGSDGVAYAKRVIDRRKINRLQRKMARQRLRAIADGRAQYKPIGRGRVRLEWAALSNSYVKTRAAHAREWQSIAEREVSAAHRVSADVVKRVLAQGGGAIAVEDLRIQNLLFNHNLARAIAEQGWGRLIGFLQYKAERAGLQFDKVNPAHTSQECSACGARLEKKLRLSQREFACPECGYIADRDENAAVNILRRAWVKRGGGEAFPRRPALKISHAVGRRGRRIPYRAGLPAQLGFTGFG